MARRGGFTGGMPGNMNNLMKQAQRMQRQMEENKKALDEKEFKATAGGGAVEVVMTGAHEMKSITIDPDAADPDDVETLQDMILVAVNDVLNQITEEGRHGHGILIFRLWIRCFCPQHRARSQKGCEQERSEKRRIGRCGERRPCRFRMC